MTILEFKRHHIVDEIIEALKDPQNEITEALIIGKKKDGGRFSFMTATDNIPELIGYLEAIKTDLTLEMISQVERDETD